ncbi:gibberellin 2-beta-dioxygenase 8 [Aristolochia californica]|uniref:gibberellin 2-beta-dioxygenase 8 n=1 Tax=Aristolochia californica TaxID=171875 RepID=UPI0035E2DE8B
MSSSYPPIFRQLSPTEQSLAFAPSPPQSNQAAIEIPLLDLQNLEKETLALACREWGIFRLINHGIPTTLSAQLQDDARNLFSLPFDCKQSTFESPVTYFWGTPALSQSVQNLNWVEGFHVPLKELQQRSLTAGDGDGEKDPILLRFRYALEEYGKHMERVARELFEALAESLALDPARRQTYLSESDGMLRIYRYPRCSAADKVLGMDVHTDSSVISILNQDGVGGLQVFKDGGCVDVAPSADALIVNLGDMMQAISSDEYKSAEHRVLVNQREERISLCYFVFPEEKGVIVSSAYKPFTYTEFRDKVQEDIKATGFKVGLERFRKIE